MEEAYAFLAGLGQAMAHPTRLHILEALARREACVCHLTALLGQRQAHVSQHLRVLKDAGWSPTGAKARWSITASPMAARRRYSAC
jgi:DNA-binding transcriptional ArsR family regulator